MNEMNDNIIEFYTLRIHKVLCCILFSMLACETLKYQVSFNNITYRALNIILDFKM